MTTLKPEAAVQRQTPWAIFSLSLIPQQLPRRHFTFSEGTGAEAAAASWKVPWKAAFEVFLETRSFARTAAHFHCSPATINGIVWQAFRIARNLAELTPP